MSLRLRPTFAMDLDAAAPTVMERLRRGLVADGLQTRWSRTPGARAERSDDDAHVLVFLTRRRFWSPWLHLEVHRADRGSHVFGRFSPHPNVWTAYLLGYLLLGTVASLCALFGASQALAGGRPTALWGVAPVAATALAMWWASQVGQRLARDEMALLRRRVDEALSGGD